MVDEIKKAIWTYIDRRDEFNKIVHNAIKSKFTWQDSAIKYKLLYLDALGRK